VERLKDEDSEVRKNAALSLVGFGSEARAAVPSLVDLLKDQKTYISVVAADTLGAIGPGANAAVPTLLKYLKHRDPSVRVTVAMALLKIAPESESSIEPDLRARAKANNARTKIENPLLASFVPAKRRVFEAGGGGGVGGGGGIGSGPHWRAGDDDGSRGAELFEQGNMEAAIASYTKAIAAAPSTALYYHIRGRAYHAIGDYAAAVADFTNAIKFEPETAFYSRTPKYYYSRGLSQLARHDYDAAIADFTQVIGFDAYYADAYHGRGLAHAGKGNYDAAIADYDQAVEFIPPVIEAFTSRAIVLQAQGKLGAAEDSYRAAARLAPDDVVVLNKLGYFLAEQNKDLAEALKLTQRAVDAQPANPSFLDSLGWVHFKLGHLDEAERYLNESVRLNRESALTHEHLGDVYARRGETRQARDAWKKALSISVEAASQARLKEKLRTAKE
jgi:tetratricopeptide (TPR) repeat protein